MVYCAGRIRTSHQVIPAEAVEAALNEWACWPPRAELVTKILEAAAPYMLAEAWDEGYTLGYADCANKQESNRPNPYILNNEGEK